MTAIDPAHDAPPCPTCGLELATPIDGNIDRWDGPPNATLFCPSCGAGWVGTAADVVRAEASWKAYEAECLSEGERSAR